MDTFEHITEFGSAADHTLSLFKWQEMGIPIETPKVTQRGSNFTSTGGSGRSVFEDKIDRTDYPEKLSGKEGDARWKFGGPWLAGQTDGEFNEYVTKQVKKRKSGFRNYLQRDVLAKREKNEAVAIADAETKAANEGNASTTKSIVEGKTKLSREELQAQKEGEERQLEEELEAYIKDLRQNPRDLFMKIRAYLDLPPVQVDSETSRTGFSVGRMSGVEGENPFPETDSPYGKTGPPKTHPSAGLSYIRTASKLYNNPEFGPQQNPPPVEARVVMPKNAVGGFFGTTLGVGGFVVAPPVDTSIDHTEYGSKNKNKQKKTIPGSQYVEADKKGGSKLWVQPKYASIDPKGRVLLNVDHATDASVAVKEGWTDRLRPEPSSVRTVTPMGGARSIRLDRPAPVPENEKTAGAKAYGLNF